MSDTIRFDLSEVDEFLQQLTAAEREIVAPLVRRSMQVSVDTIEAEVVGRTPVNTGALRDSITGAVYGQQLFDIYGEVMTPLLYGLPVEFGRKPGKAPVRLVSTGPRGGKKFEALPGLVYWVERKGLAKGQEAKEVATLIAWKIGQRGTKGAKMFQKGLRAATRPVWAVWDKMVDEIIKDIISD